MSGLLAWSDIPIAIRVACWNWASLSPYRELEISGTYNALVIGARDQDQSAVWVSIFLHDDESMNSKLGRLAFLFEIASIDE